ncbi:MAG: metallophosphoesterase family protein [Chloroflexota bacterium]
MNWTHYLPEHIKSEQVEKVIGVISDTHTPSRWPNLPSEVNLIFDGVDLILHAGDVGKLWVLDKLSHIAPVVAVHGNDETTEATEQLPYQQLISIAGRRILLWHSHFPDRKEEMAFRAVDDKWNRILNRNVERAKAADAHILIYGHTHVPMVTQREGVLILNSGAIAAGTFWARQMKTVMLLFLCKDGSNAVSHIDLSQPEAPFELNVDLEQPYSSAMHLFQTPFIDPIPTLPNFSKYKDTSQLLPMYQQLIGPYVWGTKQHETLYLSQFSADLTAYDGLHPADKAIILEALEKSMKTPDES